MERVSIKFESKIGSCVVYDESGCPLEDQTCDAGIWTYEYAVWERGLTRDRHLGVTSTEVVFKALKLNEITKAKTWIEKRTED